MQIRKKKTSRLAFLVALVMLLGTLALPVSAQRVSIKPGSIGQTAVSAYAEIPIYLENGTSLGIKGRLVNSTTYVPLRSLLSALMPGTTLTYNAKTRTASVVGEGLTLSASDKSNILYVNERCFYSDMPIRILGDGVMYLPVRLISKALSLEVAWNDASRSVSLFGKATPVLSGSLYYKEDELLWLSRIISAESRGEPFIGQVAVGNVVLNRVRHKDFPNTIWGVIFDRRYGVVQFSPVDDGSVWMDPHAASVTAAKVCLEGYSVSDDILFFYAPKYVSYTWIAQNRPYAFTIAGHKFYY